MITKLSDSDLISITSYLPVGAQLEFLLVCKRINKIIGESISKDLSGNLAKVYANPLFSDSIIKYNLNPITYESDTILLFSGKKIVSKYYFRAEALSNPFSYLTGSNELEIIALCDSFYTQKALKIGYKILFQNEFIEEVIESLPYNIQVVVRVKRTKNFIGKSISKLKQKLENSQRISYYDLFPKYY